MSKEAMQLALEALEMYQSKSSVQMFDVAVGALREALAEQPAQQEHDEVKCPECGYLTKHTEHIGCLRKQLNAINDFEHRNFAIVEENT